MWNSEVSHIAFLLSLNPSQYIYDQLRDNSGHLRTTIDQIKDRLRSELGKSNHIKNPKGLSERPIIRIFRSSSLCRYGRKGA